MASTKNPDLPPAGTTDADTQSAFRRKSVRERVAEIEATARAKGQERASAETLDEPLSGLPTAEQVIVEVWDAADLDNRLDALLTRLAETEARLDRQLARLDAEGG